jgi:hypothetical protein
VACVPFVILSTTVAARRWRWHKREQLMLQLLSSVSAQSVSSFFSRKILSWNAERVNQNSGAIIRKKFLHLPTYILCSMYVCCTYLYVLCSNLLHGPNVRLDISCCSYVFTFQVPDSNFARLNGSIVSYSPS